LGLLVDGWSAISNPIVEIRKWSGPLLAVLSVEFGLAGTVIGVYHEMAILIL